MPQPKHSHQALPLCTKRLLLPAFVSVTSFLLGLICSTVLKPPVAPPPRFPAAESFNRSAAALPPPPPAPVTAPAPVAPLAHPAQPTVGPVEIPLGLKWYKAGFENPWQASVQRTGIEDLLEAYEHVMKRDGKLPRVVVSFTSLPKRFVRHARPMIQILKKQVYMPDAIYVCIPKGSRRSDEDFHIPSWISDDPLITVLRPEVDMGPATKLIPALEAEEKLGNTHTRIVTVDDDNEGHWGDNSLLEIFAYTLRYEDAAVGRTGWNATCMVSAARCSPADSGVPRRQYADKLYNFIRPTEDYACHSLADWKKDYFSLCSGAVRKNFIGYTDVIEGYKGAAYQPRFFDLDKVKTLMDKDKTPEYFFLCDDVWISGWLSVRDVPRIVVNPAIHDNAQIRLKLMAYSDKRNLSRTVLPMSAKDTQKSKVVGEVEKGLHALGSNFVKANHDGVKWFENRGGWTKGMWDRPPGFKYPSELADEEDSQ